MVPRIVVAPNLFPLPAPAPGATFRVHNPAMNSGLFSRALVFLSLAVFASAGPVEDTIAKARAYLGPDAALDAVRTIHFKGTLELNATTRVPIDIVFQKDDRQRITASAEKVVETTALDGYDAWQKRADAATPTRWQLTLLDAQQVKKLRANTWENLHFFRGIEKRGGRVVHGGDATVDGKACVKLTYFHSETIWFARYFDQATGKLVKTETDNGSEIREEGEMMGNGIRFPKKVISKSPNGQITTITFDSLELNQPVPAAEFAVPALKPGS